MANEIGTKYSFIPWLRRGLSRQISSAETDTLAANTNEGPAKKRAGLQVKTTFGLKSVEKPENITRSETIRLALVGPGDISGITPFSILQVVPANGVKNFESTYFPFIEFFEEDLPWRYTPAKESGDKLRPWLALLVCKKEEFALVTNGNGSMYVSLKITNNESYKNIFPEPSQTWKNAHVQFSNMELIKNGQLSSEVDSQLNTDEDVAFSRLLSTRKLDENTAYTVFLVPAFETGRLSGLSIPFDEIPAQRAAWANTFDEQKSSRPRPCDFPVYYQWEFETSTGSFIDLARKLKPIAAESLPAALKVDVQKMGNGLNYSILKDKPQRKVIDVAVATKPVSFTSEAYPANPDEKVIADTMKDLLAKNPVLIENKEQTGNIPGRMLRQGGKSLASSQVFDVRRILTEKTIIEEKEYELLRKAENPLQLRRETILSEHFKATINAGKEMDDPWIVPPLYGGKHIMATSLEEEDNKNHAWFTELNLDIRHRSAAGLGKKVVQENQEQFVHRAWEQVELINELNQRLREYLLKLNVNSSIYQSRFNSKYLKDLMLYLQPMKYAPAGKEGLSLNNTLEQTGIPSAYASAAFQRMTSSKILPDNVNAASLTEKIVNDSIYKAQKHYINDLITKEQIDKLINYYLYGIHYLTLIKYV